MSKLIVEDRAGKGGLIPTLENKGKKKLLLTVLLAVINSSVMED